MKKRMRMLSLIMASAMLLGACGSSAASSGTSKPVASSPSAEGTEGGEDEQPEAETAKKMDELTHIVVCVTCPSNSADIEKVQDAINAISVEQINVEIELKDVTIVDSMFASYYTLGISSGETMDLIQIPYTDLTTYVDSVQLEPMDRYLQEYAPAVMQYAKEFPILDAGTIRGEVYGVAPVMRSYGSQGGVEIFSDYLSEIDYEAGKDIYTLEDLTAIFAQIKEKHPDCYPFTFASVASSSFPFFQNIDWLGASASSGVLLGTDSTEVVNVYDTPEYLNYLKTMREWYEAGYIMPDAATTDLTCDDILMSGKSCAANCFNSPDQVGVTIQKLGREVTVLPVTPNFTASSSKGGAVQWSIPVTTESPEAAVLFLNLLYTNSEISQLLYSGIEGEHYVDKGDHIEFPEGVAYEEIGYQNGWDLFGDTRTIKYLASYDADAYEKYTAANLANPTKAVGFAVDMSDYTAQIMAIDAIVAQYLTSLETGSVEDYESTVKEMVDKMNAAGIGEVIAETQRQFDEWRANQ